VVTGKLILCRKTEPPVLVSEDGLFWHLLTWEYEVRMDILMPENEDGDNAGEVFFEGTADSNYQRGNMVGAVSNNTSRPTNRKMNPAKVTSASNLSLQGRLLRQPSLHSL
jgi:hypothetical protein